MRFILNPCRQNTVCGPNIASQSSLKVQFYLNIAVIMLLCVHAQSLICVWPFSTPWTVTAHHAPLSMGFPRPKYWHRLPFPSPGDFSNPEINPVSPALACGFFTTAPPGKPDHIFTYHLHNIYTFFPKMAEVSSGFILYVIIIFYNIDIKPQGQHFAIIIVKHVRNWKKKMKNRLNSKECQSMAKIFWKHKNIFASGKPHKRDFFNVKEHVFIMYKISNIIFLLKILVLFLCFKMHEIYKS